MPKMSEGWGGKGWEWVVGLAENNATQPSFAGTWAELDIIKAKIIYIVLQLP